MLSRAASIAAAAAGLTPSLARAQTPAPKFPPGVRLLDATPQAAALPPGVEFHGLEIAWTSPLIRASLEIGPDESGGGPPLWERLKPETLRVQLAEPIEGDKGWRCALDAASAPAPSQSRSSRALDLDRAPLPFAPPGPADEIRVAGLTPWFFTGPRAAADPVPPSPLIEGSGRVGVRWLGRPNDWDEKPPPLELFDAWLLSVLDPLAGTTVFYLALNRTNRRIGAKFFSRWFREALPPQSWLAVHAVGPQATAGMGAWRLGEGGLTRAPALPRPLRLGAALAIQAIKPGDPVDWMRAGNPRVAASSFVASHPPSALSNGLLWPAPLRPSAWMTQPGGPEAGRTPWLDVEFAPGRPVDLIRFIHAEAAGWSSHFNLARFTVQWRGAGVSAMEAPVEINRPNGPISEIRFSATKRIDRLRVEVQDRNRLGDPLAPARLSALQIWGPLEGEPELDRDEERLDKKRRGI